MSEKERDRVGRKIQKKILERETGGKGKYRKRDSHRERERERQAGIEIEKRWERERFIKRDPVGIEIYLGHQK